MRSRDTLSSVRWSFLDARERGLVSDALPQTGSARAELDRQLDLLAHLAEVTREVPFSLAPEALVETLRDARHDADLKLPPVAAFGSAFTLTKIALLRDLSRALPEGTELRRLAEVEHAQSIHSHLVEEHFVAVTSDGELSDEARLAAARKLLTIWRDPVHTEIDDVAPLLDSIWEARRRLKPVIGTLLGTHEILSLFTSSKDERFLDHFTAGQVDEDELMAFREFLLGLSTEEQVALQAEMEARGLSVLSLREARVLLGLPDDDGGEMGLGVIGPEAMVASYRARKVKASYRVLTGAPGPRRTAEEHVVIARLAGGQAL